MSLHLCLLVLVVAAAVPLSTVRCDNKCAPRNNTSIVDVSTNGSEEKDGLTPLLAFAASVRQGVFPSTSTDYTKLREDIRNM